MVIKTSELKQYQALKGARSSVEHAHSGQEI